MRISVHNCVLFMDTLQQQLLSLSSLYLFVMSEKGNVHIKYTAYCHKEGIFFFQIHPHYWYMEFINFELCKKGVKMLSEVIPFFCNAQTFS